MSKGGDMTEDRCGICGRSDGCRCWITTHCPECGKTGKTNKMDTDPVDSDCIEQICFDCWKGKNRTTPANY